MRHIQNISDILRNFIYGIAIPFYENITLPYGNILISKQHNRQICTILIRRNFADITRASPKPAPSDFKAQRDNSVL